MVILPFLILSSPSKPYSYFHYPSQLLNYSQIPQKFKKFKKINKINKINYLLQINCIEHVIKYTRSNRYAMLYCDIECRTWLQLYVLIFFCCVSPMILNISPNETSTNSITHPDESCKRPQYPPITPPYSPQKNNPKKTFSPLPTLRSKPQTYSFKHKLVVKSLLDSNGAMNTVASSLPMTLISTYNYPNVKSLSMTNLPAHLVTYWSVVITSCMYANLNLHR